MDTYKNRYKLIRESLDKLHENEDYKKLDRFEQVKFNNKWVMSNRHGLYLIKIARSNKPFYDRDTMYLSTLYNADGWFSFTKRKYAQWFTGQEVNEFLRTHKGFTAVKR